MLKRDNKERDKYNAELWHSQAYAMECNQRKTGNWDEKPAKLYEKAARAWEVIGDEERATENYAAALYASEKANRRKLGIVSRKKIGDLEKKIPKFSESSWEIIVAVPTLILSLFLLATNFPNNAVQLSPGIDVANAGFGLGIILLFIGLLTGYSWYKKK